MQNRLCTSQRNGEGILEQRTRSSVDNCAKPILKPSKPFSTLKSQCLDGSISQSYKVTTDQKIPYWLFTFYRMGFLNMRVV